MWQWGTAPTFSWVMEGEGLTAGDAEHTAAITATVWDLT